MSNFPQPKNPPVARMPEVKLFLFTTPGTVATRVGGGLGNSYDH